MNPKVLPAEAWTLVKDLAAAEVLGEWILAGGTGLALQLGHRISLDLDFFHEADFDGDSLRGRLSTVGSVEIQAQQANTLHLLMNGVRLSFRRSEAPFLFPAVPYRGLDIADVRDIAAMKVVAVAGRGSRKDFVDLHAYLEAGGDFPALMDVVRRRYAGPSFNEVHLLRSLVYFEDAEQEPMPRMIHGTTWEDVRKRLEEEVRRWAP